MIDGGLIDHGLVGFGRFVGHKSSTSNICEERPGQLDSERTTNQITPYKGILTYKPDRPSKLYTTYRSQSLNIRV